MGKIKSRAQILQEQFARGELEEQTVRPTQWCSGCAGKGKVKIVEQDGLKKRVVCNNCNGLGYIVPR